MAGYGADLVNLVDARIAAADRRTRNVGTFVQMEGTYAMVSFDGSTLALPCKYISAVPLKEGARVTLEQYGSDWVVTGTFNRKAKSLSDIQVGISSGTVSMPAGAGLPVTDIPGTLLTFEATIPGAVWVARYSADCQMNIAGTNLRMVIQLAVSVGGTYPQAIWDPANVTAAARETVSNFASGVFTDPGIYYFELQAFRVASGTAAGQVNTSHTSLTVELYE